MWRISLLGLGSIVLLALGCIGSPAMVDPVGDESPSARAAVDGDGAMLLPLAPPGEEDPQEDPPKGEEKKASEGKSGLKKPPTRPTLEKPAKKPEQKTPPKKPEAKKPEAKKPAKKPKGKSVAREGKAKPRARKGAKDAMKEYASEQGVLEQARKSFAESYLKSGKRKMERLDWRGAEKDFKKAYDLDPSSEEAQELFFRAQMILGKRIGTMKSAIRKFGEGQEVIRQQHGVEIHRTVDEGRAFYDGREYEKAIRKFEQAEALLSSDSLAISDSADLMAKVRSHIAESKRQKKADELARNRHLTEKARQSAVGEETRRRRAEKDKVNLLLDLAIEQMEVHRYAKALDLLKDVLDLDPENRIAIQLRDESKEGSFLHREWTSLHRSQEERMRSIEGIVEGAIPYTDFVRFPVKDKWLDVAKRVEGTGAAFAEENPEIRRMREVLNNRKVSIDFNDTALDAVVAFLQDVTGLNMQISPQIDAADVPVTLSLNDALLANALKLIMEKIGYTYTFKEEVIYIAEEGEEEGELIFEIYNVQDILNKIEDFTGPEIKVHSADAPQPGGGGGAGQLVFDDDDDDDLEGTIDPDKLTELIESSTGEENWGDRENASIEHHRGQLLINNTREVHQEVQRVLENLRKNAGLFVVVEARFIDLFDDFLSEVGIDYRGLPTAPIGNSTGVLAPNQSGGTDTGAERTAGTSTDNVIGRLQGVFDGFTGFLTGTRLTGGTLPGRNIPGLSIQSTFIEPFQVNAILRARDEKSRVQLLSAPVITAANRQRVFISAITQRAYISDYELASGGTGFVAVEVADPIIQTFEEGVILDVRPTISSDRRYVTLDAKPTLAQLVGGFISTILVDLGSINQAAQQVPIGIPEITLQEAYTSVTIPDGGTALLGGFRSLNEQKLRSSIPVLDSIPILNVLWSRKGELSEKRSLVILITARVMVLRDQEKALFSTE